MSKDWVRVNSLGDDRGSTITIGKGHIKDMGLDPDADLEVKRYPSDGEKKMFLSFREVSDV